MGVLSVTERRKYEAAWKHDGYRVYSPGEWLVPLFNQLVRKPGSLVDIGCGTGRAAKLLSSRHDVTCMDFARNALEVDLPFVPCNLFGRWPAMAWDYGYCCDVMEHIPPEYVDKVLRKISEHCAKVFFSIHFSEDQFGAVVGHPLHLTVKPFTWWRDKLGEYFEVKEARDLIGMGVFLCV